ncbi:MAG: flagellar biosynthesis protein FliQ [Tepidisphaeraceae bacterium]
MRLAVLGGVAKTDRFSDAGAHGRVLMESAGAIDLVRQTLFLAMLISAPMLLIGLVVGVIVSLLQAITQIQEQTLSFVPKIAAMIAAALLLMPWISQRLLDYATVVFSGASR